MNKERGNLFVFAAPSGAGKTSLVTALTDTIANIRPSVSHTTRPKRPGEQEGENYFFVDEERFAHLVKQGAFLEHAQVFDYRYGTSKAWVEDALTAGTDVILEIDWQGAQQIRTVFSDCTTIFILPPSIQALRERLQKRKQDAPAVIEKRIAAAQSEMSHYDEFDYLVINDEFEDGLADLEMIIRTMRLRCTRQARKHAALVADLLIK